MRNLACNNSNMSMFINNKKTKSVTPFFAQLLEKSSEKESGKDESLLGRNAYHILK